MEICPLFRRIFLLSSVALLFPSFAQAGSGTITYDEQHLFSSATVFLPEGIDVDSTGKIYVLGSDTRVYDTDGTFLTTLFTGSGAHIRFLPDDTFIVADYNNSTNERYDTDGNFIEQFGSGFSINATVILSPDGTKYYVGDRDNNRIRVYNIDGTHDFDFTGNGADGMGGMAFDSNGRLFIPRYFGNRIDIFDLAGNYLSTFQTSPALVRTVVIDNYDNVYDTGHYNSVRIHDIDGNLLYSFGSAGTGDGEFGAFMTDLAQDDAGRIYVADYNNNRIQVFEFSSTEEFAASPGGGDEHATTPLSYLRLAGAGGDYSFADDFIDYDTLEIDNAGGSWTLSGSNDFSDTLTLTDGTLVNNGTITADGGATFDAGTTYGGTGTLAADTVFNGTLAPGNSIGTTNVTGNATFNGGSTFDVEIDPASADRLNVTGNVTINGGDVVVTAADVQGYARETDYTIINAGGTVTGTFDSITDNLAFLDMSLVYGASSVVLNVMNNNAGFADYAQTPGQQSVAGVLDALLASGGGDAAVVNAAFTGLSEAQAVEVLDQVSPQEAASLNTLRTDIGTRFVRTNTQRLNNVQRQLNAIESAAGEETAEFTGRLALRGETVPERVEHQGRDDISFGYGAHGARYMPYGGWVRGFGTRGNIDGDASGPGYSYDTWGTLLGLDWLTDAGGIWGLSGGWAKALASFDEGADSAELDQYRLGVYGRHALPADFMIDAQLGFAWSRQETQRIIDAGGLNRTAFGRTHGAELTAGFDVSRPFGIGGGFILTPEAGAKAAWYRQSGYSETGAGVLDTHIDALIVRSLRPGAGATLSRSWSVDETQSYTPYVYTRMDYELGDETSTLVSNFTAAPDDSFNVEGPETGRHSFNMGLGLNYEDTATGAELSLGYDAVVNAKTDIHTLSAQMKWKF